MACNIATGRKEVTCKENLGGIKNVYLFNYVKEMYGEVTEDGGLITAYSTGADVFKIELQGTGNSFDEAGEVSRENGTVLYGQTLTIALKQQDPLTKDFLNTLGKGRPHAIIEDYNNTFRLAGIENGLDAQISTASGSAMGDLSGYTIVLTGQERDLSPFVTPALVAADAAFDVQVETAANINLND